MQGGGGVSVGVGGGEQLGGGQPAGGGREIAVSTRVGFQQLCVREGDGAVLLTSGFNTHEKAREASAAFLTLPSPFHPSSFLQHAREGS